MLKYYSEHFNSIEINASFYKTLLTKTVVEWERVVGKDFAFTYKGSKFITHNKKLKIEPESYAKFYEPLEPVSYPGNKHCILFQMPERFKKNAERLENFLKFLPVEFRNAFDFRDSTWFDKEIYTIMKKYNAAIVLNDSPIEFGNRKWPLVAKETADFFYIRFHGSQKLYTSKYSEEELDHYAGIIKKKLKRKLDVYVYFNNDSLGHAPWDAQRLKEKVFSK